MEATNKYIVWTSPNTGDFVKADRVEEQNGMILFMILTKDGTFKLAGIYPKQTEYSEVTNTK